MPDRLSPAEQRRRIGRRVASARVLLGLNQADLAVRMGLSSQTISDLEKGKRSVRGEELGELAEALDVQVAWLLQDVTTRVVHQARAPGSPPLAAIAGHGGSRRTSRQLPLPVNGVPRIG